MRDVLADLPVATLTGLSVIQLDTEQTIHRDLPRLLLVAGGLVGLYLLVYYRSITDTLLAALPTLFSFAVLLAFMRVAGQELNLMNLVAIPLLIGIDIDYGIFLVSLARRSLRDGTDLTEGIASSCHAIGVSAISTIFGFGSLISTSVPAIRSLGWAVGVGVAACLVGTLFLLAPILIARSHRGATKARSSRSSRRED